VVKILTNVWGNTNGYCGVCKVVEFGTDRGEAEAWLAFVKARIAPGDTLATVSELTTQFDEATRR